MSDKVLEGMDAARRAGWARAFAAEKQVEELKRDLSGVIGIARSERVHTDDLLVALEQASVDLSRLARTLPRSSQAWMEVRRIQQSVISPASVHLLGLGRLMDATEGRVHSLGPADLSQVGS